MTDPRAFFGPRAQAYRESRSHGNPRDLERMLRLVEPTPRERALDVATGGGHTACALHAAGCRVIATDVTREMLTLLPGEVPGVLADAHALPFRAGSFDLVASRLAPHHFRRLDRFVAEGARLLRPGGRFYVFDLTVPEDPGAAEAINRVERLRDPSHVASHPPSAWRRAFDAAGLSVESLATGASEVDLGEWIARARMPAGREGELRRLLGENPPDRLGGYGVTGEGRMRLLRVEVLAERP